MDSTTFLLILLIDKIIFLHHNRGQHSGLRYASKLFLSYFFWFSHCFFRKFTQPTHYFFPTSAQDDTFLHAINYGTKSSKKIRFFVIYMYQYLMLEVTGLVSKPLHCTRKGIMIPHAVVTGSEKV